MNKPVDFSTYNNDWYKSKIGAGKIKQLLWYLVNVLFFLNPLNLSSGLKVFLLRLFGAKVGQSVTVKPGVNIKYPWLLTIGANTWIGEKVWIDNLTRVIIGNNVCLSQGCMLLTGNHNYRKTTFDLFVRSIVLEDGVWIGAMALVCPGVTCSSHSVLSVMSVATSNLSAYKIYQGNPAVEIKDRVVNS